MKRKAPEARSGGSYQDVTKDFSNAQLRSIGEIAMHWNEISFTVDCTLYTGLNLDSVFWTSIVGEIQDSKKGDFIKKIASRFKIQENTLCLIETTANSYKELKDYRDSVIHARIFDRSSGVGTLIRREKIYEVLLTEETLTGLCKRLKILKQEIAAINQIFSLVRSFFYRIPPDKDILSCVPEVQQYIDLLKSLQSSRQSLPPLPPFPK